MVDSKLSSLDWLHSQFPDKLFKKFGIVECDPIKYTSIAVPIGFEAIYLMDGDTLRIAVKPKNKV